MKKQFKFYASFFIIVLSLINWNCKKEENNEQLIKFENKVLAVSTKDRLSSIESMFIKNRIGDSINRDAEKTGLIWTPDWDNPLLNIVNDSVTYHMYPFIIQSKVEGEYKTAKEIGQKTYLIVKNEKEFYKGTYLPIAKNKDIILSTFTGSLRLENLENRQAFKIEYKHGKVDDTYLKKSLEFKNKKNSGEITTAGWQHICTTQTNCSWNIVCQGQMFVTFTNGCTYPALPASGCYDAWYMTGENEVITCQDIYFDDPPNPTDPGNGSGGDNGNSNYLQPNTYIFQLQENIKLQDYFKCFEKVSSTSTTLYSLSLNADLPNNNDANWLINSSLNPGHAFITLTKSDGTNSVTVSFGFYPSISVLSITGAAVGSMVNDDGGHEFNASISTGLSSLQFQSALETAVYLAGHANYDLNDYNCTDYAIEIYNSTSPRGNLIVPDWIGPDGITNFGTTPNGLYNVLVKRRPHQEGIFTSPPKGAPCN